MISLFRKRQDLKELSMEDLARRYASKRERGVFAEIYDRSHVLVHGACLKYLKDSAAAHDATMDVFEDLMRLLAEQREIANFNAWLYMITRNSCYARMKQAQKMQTRSLDEKFVEKNPTDFMENGHSDTLIKEEEYQSRENALKQAIAKLKPEQRACVCAFYLEGKAYKQIEMELGYPISKVKSYIQNGKRNLRIALENKIGDLR